MNLFAEAGPAAWMTLLLTLAGIALALTLGRRAGRSSGVTTGFSAAVLASGVLGTALGQRNVDRAVMATQDAAARLQMLSAGTREATANLLISGAAAFVLLAIGAALWRSAPAPTRS